MPDILLSAVECPVYGCGAHSVTPHTPPRLAFRFAVQNVAQVEHKRPAALLQEPATQILQNSDMERLLLLTGGVLTGASAMELRAVLLAVAQVQTWRSAQLTLQEVAQSTAALRTMGHMLLPRLEGASVEESMAAAMLAQGGSVAQLTQELEEALQPLSGGSTV